MSATAPQKRSRTRSAPLRTRARKRVPHAVCVIFDTTSAVARVVADGVARVVVDGVAIVANDDSPTSSGTTVATAGASVAVTAMSAKALGALAVAQRDIASDRAR